MEIGTEISKKIRAAIKSKLQELGAYIDEELPDYIMVMVANKKTLQQMSDDLSLFLGNNTIKFTTWLHGVLEKLRSVAGEPESLKQLQPDTFPLAEKSSLSVGENGRAEEMKVLSVSSSRSDKTEARVSSSGHESRKGMLEKLSSSTKPVMEALPSEAVIDIKPEMYDDFIGDDVELGNNYSRTRRAASKPTVEIYRPGQNEFSTVGSGDMCRHTEGPSYIRQQDSRSGRLSRSGSNKQEELSRKRKAPVASSVVRVSREADEESDDPEEEEEDEASYSSRSLSSRVSLPLKQERKPTLPPAKQANRNLILKAISEAQDSITKTTSYPKLPQRQTVPVAPRARLTSSEEMTAAIQLVQEHLHSLPPRVQAYVSTDLPPRKAAPTRSLASRLQLENQEASAQNEHVREAPAVYEPKPFDTRSFIMSRPQLDDAPARSLQHVQSALPRTVQAREGNDSSSPKFIVTLDGVPSPLGNLIDGEMELDDVRLPRKLAETLSPGQRESQIRFQEGITSSEDERMDYEETEEETTPVKKQKVMERCKFWPLCKSGDECAYHHPTTQCKTFPNCKFGDKCLFVHPNCKYDARCTKPDCPFTHVCRRNNVAPPPRPAMKPAQTSVCRFFPECKKMDCPFYHPKPCRFAMQCKRVGCTFYHPTTAVPPRHALKWTKTQSS